MAIFNTLLNSGGNTTVYTANGDKMLSTMIFCNTIPADPYNEDNNMAYLDLHLVKSGDTLTTTKMIVNSIAIPAGETVFFDTERIVLEIGDTVMASLASAGVPVACTISVVDI